MSNLKKTAVRSAKWTIVSSTVSAITGPVYKIILGLLLVKAEFAYLSIITLINTLASLIGDLGIGKSLIKKKDVDNEEFTAALLIKLMIAIVIGFIIIIISKPIEKFYGYVGLGDLLRLSFITIVISSINNIFSNVLQKELLFKEYSISNILRNSIDMIASIVYILIGFGVKGYVYGTITAVLICTLYNIRTVFNKTKFKLIRSFKIKEPKDFFGFGISISIKDILTYIVGKLDEIIIGKLLGANVLGVYFFGKDFVKKPQEIISTALTQSLFPILVQIKENKEKLKNWYLKITQYMSMIAFPIFLGLAITCDYYMKLLYGNKWDNSIVIIKLFCIITLITILTSNITTSTLYAINKQNKVLLIDIIMNFIYIVFLVITHTSSLYAIVAIYFSYTFIKCLWLQGIVRKSLGYKWKAYLQCIYKPALSSIIMLDVIFLVNTIINNKLSSIYILIIDVVLGISIYVVTMYSLDKDSLADLKKMLF